MYKIFKLSILTVGVALLASCSQQTVTPPPALTTKVDVSGSTFAGSLFISAAKPSVANDALTNPLYFSTDDGKTFSQFPDAIATGKNYQVTIFNLEIGMPLTDPKIYVLDWSKSNPAPTDAGNIASFTYAGSNSIMVSVTCPYSAANWTGAWVGEEVNPTGSIDNNVITQDAVNPNKFTMDNFFGDGVTAYFILTPSSTANIADHVLTLPAQSTSEGGTISLSTGTYDPCRQTFTFPCKYKLGATTYTWTYNFHR